MMALPIRPPFAPMEAQLVAGISEGGGWQYGRLSPAADELKAAKRRNGSVVETPSG